MSGGFSFPPPPPPPPKATASWEQDNTTPAYVQRGAQRGRGRANGRGSEGGARGYGSYRGNSSTGHGLQPPGQGHVPNTSSRIPSSTSHVQNNPSSLLPGTYVNPNFHPQHGSCTSTGKVQNQRHENVHQAQHSVESPSRTVAGHKRKLEILRGPPQDRVQPSPPVAPVIPSYGSSVQPLLSQDSRLYTSAAQRAPAGNAFGLVPVERDIVDELSDASDEDKELDEEALFAELGDKLTFEHNGTVMVLKTAADLAAWQDERRRKWPTRARMETKDAEKRVIGAERRRLLSAATAILNGPMAGMNERKIRRQENSNTHPEQTPNATTVVEPETEVQSLRRHMLEQTEKLESMRKRVAISQAKLDEHKAKQAAEDERLAEELAQSPPINGDSPTVQRVQDASEEVSDNSSESSVVSTDSDDDGRPEEASSKQSEIVSTDSRPVCKYFTASGSCRDGDGCRFRHDPSAHVQRNTAPPRSAPRSLPLGSTSDRKGIYQRLAEQEQEENDRLVLQVVKSLGKAGFFE